VAAAPRVVLFNFDGVLMHGDAFHLFVRERYARSLWRKGLVLIVTPLLLSLLPFSRHRATYVLVRIALLGLREHSYGVAANAFAAALARQSRHFSRDALFRLRHHQAQGDRVIVVTACEDTLVNAILRELGLSGLEVIASQLRSGWIGMRPRRRNVGRRKLQSLGEQGVTAWQVAYGSSMRDIALLKPTAEPVLVNGTPTLCKKVEKALGRTVNRVQWC
jgi:phosphatidylglycerophosphatase C